PYTTLFRSTRGRTARCGFRGRIGLGRGRVADRRWPSEPPDVLAAGAQAADREERCGARPEDPEHRFLPCPKTLVLVPEEEGYRPWSTCGSVKRVGDVT